MTDKQQKFADEYLIDCNATRAYKAAYPKVKKEDTARVNGSRLLTNANIKEYIDERLAKISDEKIADATEVMTYLTSVLRSKSKSNVLAMCKDGHQKVITKPPDEREKLKAAELLGKRYSIFTEKMKVEGSLPVVISDNLKDDDSDE